MILGFVRFEKAPVLHNIIGRFKAYPTSVLVDAAAAVRVYTRFCVCETGLKNVIFITLGIINL